MPDTANPKFNLFAVGAFPPALGGGERSGWTIIQRLARLGHSITVFSQEIPGEKPPHAKNVRFVQFKTERQIDVSPRDFALARPIKGFFQRRVARKPLVDSLYRELELQRPDAIIVNFGAPWARFVLRTAKKQGIPVVAILHGSDVHTLPEQGFRRSRRAILKAYKKIDARVAVADYLKRILQSFGITDIKVLRNAIDASRFRQLEPDKRVFLRRRLGIPKNAIVFTHVSYLGAIKDPLKIIEAGEIAVMQNPNIHFLIVGEGPMRMAMQKMAREKGISKKFTFTGEATPAQTRRFFGISDVHIMSSIREGTPLAILEASATGIPTIASKVGGIPEIVLDGFNGLLFEQGNAKEFAEKILELSRPALRQRLSKGAKQWSRAVSLKKRIREYNEVIRDTIQARQQKPRGFFQDGSEENKIAPLGFDQLFFQWKKTWENHRLGLLLPLQ